MPNILVVEDDEMNREMLARHLKWEGYQIVTAANGVQAIALAHSEAIDLILMDMGLPILDGWQATQRLKRAPATQGDEDYHHHRHRRRADCCCGLRCCLAQGGRRELQLDSIVVHHSPKQHY